MSTSEPPAPAPPTAPEGDASALAALLTPQIEELARAWFATGGPPPAAFDPNVQRVPSAVQSVGLGGASPLSYTPAVPGSPLIASAPVPKPADLRNVPATLSDAVRLPLGPPPALDVPSFAAGPPALPGASQEGSVPYFLQLAGPPVPQAAPVPAAPQGGVEAPAQNAAIDPRTRDEALPQGDDLLVTAVSHTFRPDVVPAGISETRRPFDPHVVKRDFPILRERIHGRELVWLDNAATTQKPRAVIDRLSTFYERENSNVHRAAHTLAARATDALEKARETSARFLNASPDEIVFVRGATEAINLVAQSWGRRHVNEGDEIVVTWLEHHANIVPWQQLCGERGARLRVAPVDSQGQVLLEAYERLLGPKTKIVSIAHVSNALGTVLPVREMVEMAHRHGAVVLVDGAQAVSHMPVDVQTLDCDFYVFSGHKVFGPTGIGVLFGKQDVFDAMPPWQGGGNMIADVTFERTVYQAPPSRFEAGTASIADAAGLAAALEYVTAIGMETIHRYEAELLETATAKLLQVPGLSLVGTAPDKAGVLSFVLDGVRTQDVGALLDQEGIAVRAGHHCAQPIHRRYGLESTVRASLALYNTPEDIDALVAALRRLQAPSGGWRGPG